MIDFDAALAGSIGSRVREVQGCCLEAGSVLGGGGADTAAFRALSGRTPFPSIRGPFPVDRKRPYLDLRRLNDE